MPLLSLYHAAKPSELRVCSEFLTLLLSASSRFRHTSHTVRKLRQAAGSATDQVTGATRCQHCWPGHFSNFSAVKCQLCDAGRHQGAPNQISCASCPAGQFGIGNRTGCVRCPARTFCANSGAHSVDYCVACGKGSETQKLSGEYISTGGAKCAKCQPGDYTANETNTSLFRCLLCKGGFVTDTFSDSGATRCVACAVGKASPKS